MNICKKAVIWCSLIFLSFISDLSAETLVGGVGDWRPWTIAEEFNSSGILVDIFSTAVERAGYEAKVVVMPNKRRNEIEWGRSIFAELAVLPEWRTKYAQTSVYTIPFIATQDVILAPKGAMDKAASVEDFYGKRLGTTLGYFYVDGFSDAFNAGKYCVMIP